MAQLGCACRPQSNLDCEYMATRCHLSCCNLALLPVTCAADSSGKKIKCGQMFGGSLISSQHIITAASCLAQADINNTVVFLEVTSVQNALMSLDYLFLSEIHLYPGPTQGDTVAIIKLEKEVNFGSTINQICLSEPFTSYQDVDEALITGWQEFDQINAETTDASAVTVTIKSEEYCNEQFENVFIKSQTFTIKNGASKAFKTNYAGD